MRRCHLLLLAVAVLLAGLCVGCRRSSSPTADRPAAPQRTESRDARPSPISRPVSRASVVYVTDSGKKYHREACKYLGKSQHKMARKKAQSAGYTACTVCDP